MGEASHVPEDPMPAPWAGLAQTLAGSFAARARGLLGSDFDLVDQGGRGIGTLRVRGPEGARFEAGPLEAGIERTSPRRYALLANGARVLSAEIEGPPDAARIGSAGRLYEARLSLLRNTAEAVGGAGRAARVTGGLTNRRYDVAFDPEDGGSLFVALFLLYRLVALRRGAYLTGAG